MDHFFLGAAAGLALYRLFIALFLWCDPDQSARYCAFHYGKECPRMKSGRWV